MGRGAARSTSMDVFLPWGELTWPPTVKIGSRTGREPPAEGIVCDSLTEPRN